MEIQNPRIFSLSNRYSVKLYTKKNPPTFFRFPLQISRNFRVSAHFNGRRKNHLRKKLIEQQVRQNPINTSPSTLEISDENTRTRDDASTSNALLLESWANQHKAGADFWSKVDKVDVIQDELLNNVQHNANLLAKEMEMGKAPNSSLANFVNSSGFIGSFTRNPAKLSRVGVSVFCGFLLFIALCRKGKGNKKEEYSSLEKEMLRRKVKARMAKEKSVKGSVEVIQDSKEPEPEPDMTVFKERPQLDKEELMNSIVKVKALDDTCLDKIQEIRAMARHAREIESSGESIDNQPDGKEVNPAPFDVSLPQDGSSIQDVGNSSSDALRLDLPQAVVGEGSNLFDMEKVLDNATPSCKAVKLRIISSVKEAREYLHKKEKKHEPETNNLHQVPKRDSEDDVFGNTAPSLNQSWKDTSMAGDGDLLNNNNDSKDERAKGSGGELERAKREKWIEDNFHEFEPLVEKIRGGFRKNYMVAREKVKEDLNLVSELERDENESEFEWMKDEKLREIVFQVRENELMGRDPFYLMDTQDKALFFKGLEEKIEKENEKLGHLHDYLHSNIENLDYGADGISLYDPPEKIIPRWKGPPPATTMSQEFLDDYLDQRKALFAETLGNVDLDSQNILRSSNNVKVVDENLKSSNTVIEGSDGSKKPGKKSGKEFWEHTKKWSRGFIDSYNAENDPETKAAMKDIGKDLDRWITEKEIQDAADIMDKVPDKGKKFIAEKINKLKREMELFGPQAVVSKYSEYGDEEEIDYYWWLDLPYLLCIEMYIDGDGDERIGFYSLEMASDLELDPKPHHIIAFEDAGDCKNLCYIIQTHMEMLGNGNAFVVPQMPKDTYQEAKANGFNVTVIRKGELKLDVDQTLEEVEEKIVEIGSKMYHDKIMKAHNVDVDSVMKGVFGFTSRRLKRPTK
ncbi:hypothetical protein Hdeb2414_s0086g00785401 [Helianthus debilis subsp. tardiflorus]